MIVHGSTVECYSGHTYAQEPRVIVWKGHRCLVAQVEQRWRRPEGPAFLVRTEPGDVFELHYHDLEDHWSVRLLSDTGDEPAVAGHEACPEGRA